MRYHGDVTMSEDSAARLFDHAIQADSEFAPAWVHAVELSFRRGATVGRHYADAYLARNPRDVEAQGLQVAATLADPTLSPRTRMAIVDTLSLDVIRRAFPALLQLADSAEVAVTLARAGLRHATASARRLWTINLAYALSTRGHIAEAWSLALESRNYVAGEIAGLGLVPTDSALRLVRPWLDQHSDGSLVPIPLLAMAHDTGTLLRTARSIDSAMPMVPSATQRAMMTYFAASTRAYAALAKNDTTAATRLFDALPDSILALPLDEFMRARLVARQDPRRALKVLEIRGNPDLLVPARALERARIAERIGDRPLAVESYARVVDLWQNADAPSLRDARDEARAALQRLDADGRMRAELAHR
jgi:hypothetical protein